jgi:hypothetical protein
VVVEVRYKAVFMARIRALHDRDLGVVNTGSKSIVLDVCVWNPSSVKIAISGYSLERVSLESSLFELKIST